MAEKDDFFLPLENENLREVMIKFWYLYAEDTPENMCIPPIRIRYIIDMDQADKEGFKAAAREQFEKILKKWEEAQNG